MHLSDIDYDLPQNLIAQHPIEPRDAARLLVDIDLNTSNNEVAHRLVSDFVEFVRPGDVVVVNHTRVMPARVILHRASGVAAGRKGCEHSNVGNIVATRGQIEGG